MKRRKNVAILAALLILSICLAGCGVQYNEAQSEMSDTNWGQGYFTIVKKWGATGAGHMIVYANDTKVMYYVDAQSKAGGITPLFNADGTLQVYKGEP